MAPVEPVLWRRRRGAAGQEVDVDRVRKVLGIVIAVLGWVSLSLGALEGLLQAAQVQGMPVPAC